MDIRHFAVRFGGILFCTSVRRELVHGDVNPKFLIYCFVSKAEPVKGNYGRNYWPNFTLVNPCKNYGRVGEMSKSISRVRPGIKPRMYFVWDAAWLSERLESGCQKNIET